jgi:hypothetical protein
MSPLGHRQFQILLRTLPNQQERLNHVPFRK